MLLLLGVLLAVLAAVTGYSSAQAGASTLTTHGSRAASVASGNAGTTVDPLRYNCGNDAPTCGQVGESYGYYNGTNVDLLYSENYYCDTAVPSHAATGCEVGQRPVLRPDPTAPSPDGTSLGNTTHGDTLYIPVPLFAGAPPTQCTATATCIDHPPTIDLSAIAGALAGESVATRACDNVPDPGPRPRGRHPQRRAARVVERRRWSPPTDPATFATLTSVSAINGRRRAPPRPCRCPTNAFLFFQVLAGHRAGGPGRQPDGHRPAGSGGRPPPRPRRRPARSSRAPPSTTSERLRGHGTQLPGHRHQPRLDRRPGRGRPLHRAVLLRHHGGDRRTRPPAVRPGAARPRCRRACPTPTPPTPDGDEQADRPAVHPGAAVLPARRWPTPSAPG